MDRQIDTKTYTYTVYNIIYVPAFEKMEPKKWNPARVD